MDHKDHVAKCRRNPEYREVERRLKPFMDLADDVLRLRMERGWTQEELADRAGTKQANISRLENALANPTLQFLQKVSEAFGTELNVSLRGQPGRVETRVVPILVSSQEYQNLLTLSVNIPARADSTAEMVKVVA